MSSGFITAAPEGEAALFYGLASDPFPFQHDGVAAPEVDVVPQRAVFQARSMRILQPSRSRRQFIALPSQVTSRDVV